MQAKIRWLEGASFLGESESGHAIVLDGPPDGGGRNIGMRPMELLLLGMGGCSAYDVVYILQKARQNISDCRLEITAKRAQTVPKVFTHIHMHFVVEGKQLSIKQVERAVELSAEKYCSATMMLKSTVDISHDFEVLERSG